MNTREKLNAIGAVALSSRETLEQSYDLARLAIERGIPGDFVECGVYAGSQCAAMALAIMDHLEWDEVRTGLRNPARRVHLFDSFEGIPAAGPRDDTEWQAKPAGTSACPMQYVQERMLGWGIPEELLVYHPGWFDVTVPPPPDGAGILGAWERGSYPHCIAVLRLDGDLYESTRVCLEHLYPLVSRGGWCIIDDFALQGARNAVIEYFSGGPGPIAWRKEPR